MQNLSHTNDIKFARRLHNEAIRDRDVNAICSFLTTDYYVVTGKGVKSHGIEEQRKRWQAAFAQDPIMLYRRKSKKIHTRSLLKTAEEVGIWSGKYTAELKEIALVAGVYAAKWQKQTNGLWLIQAEIFTTLRVFYQAQEKIVIKSEKWTSQN